MRMSRWFGAIVVGLLVAPLAIAQEAAKPGPEHAVLKKLEGTWDATMNMGGMESKGVTVYKADLNGLWLMSSFEAELFGAKFTGRGQDGYDPGKKKYIGTWVDSMSFGMVSLEGTYDADKKTMTMTGEGPGPDGKPQKYKTVSEHKDDNTIHFSMYMGDGKGPSFTIAYKRRK